MCFNFIGIWYTYHKNLNTFYKRMGRLRYLGEMDHADSAVVKTEPTINSRSQARENTTVSAHKWDLILILVLIAITRYDRLTYQSFALEKKVQSKWYSVSCRGKRRKLADWKLSKCWERNCLRHNYVEERDRLFSQWCISSSEQSVSRLDTIATFFSHKLQEQHLVLSFEIYLWIV